MSAMVIAAAYQTGGAADNGPRSRQAGPGRAFDAPNDDSPLTELGRVAELDPYRGVDELAPYADPVLDDEDNQ